MARRASHRSDWHDEKRLKAQERTYRLAKLFAAVRALGEILESLRPLAPRTYELEPALVSRARRISSEAFDVYQSLDEGGEI